MTKSELILEVWRDSNFTQKDVAAIVGNVFWQIGHALIKGDTVQITGFGTFEVAERAERKGINPRTGEEVTIPAHKTPTFRAGKNLKEAVNDENYRAER